MSYNGQKLNLLKLNGNKIKNKQFSFAILRIVYQSMKSINNLKINLYNIILGLKLTITLIKLLIKTKKWKQIIVTYYKPPTNLELKVYTFQ